ncbi:putative D-amino acid oxidase [Pseudovirgaria hyperparasitica]|uniref:D-amino acid oxidase n=1 Tax=Pseudovirgaria hyperparasitica TaxID=470096 RepID=A0A6A6VZN9_9PEZI|nr:putative D-amino acid oxidase [Pseudovirgaria hyperparasitica]KAF2755753.1 putative D-amino acid oxidase [Pseudovirgaria hyperparasitica]
MASITYAVLGAGVIGLSTAIELKTRFPDAKVIIAAKYFPGDRSIKYCSPWAGANWLSIATEDQVLHEWEAETYRRLQTIATSVPEAAVTKMDIHAFYDSPPEQAGIFAPGSKKLWYEDLVGGVSQIANADLATGAQFGYVIPTFMINTQGYLAWLNTECLRLGIEMRRSSFDDIRDFFHAVPANAYFNCTGLGSYHLKGVEDKALYPTKGQIMLVESPKVQLEHMYLRSPKRVDSDTTYVFPRNPSGGVILGGCRIDNDWSDKIDIDLAEDIKRRCCALAPELGKPEDLKVVYHCVGLRPGREGGPRMESEVMGGHLVIHNYGASGAGYQASWGMAQKAVDIMQQISQSNL